MESLPIYSYHIDTNIRYSCFRLCLRWGDLEGYFGARYYNSDWSIWLSVDPLAHKYPSHSPYVYCSNNPIGRVDPTGMLDDDYTAKSDGSIDVVKTNDSYDRFFVENTDGTTSQVAQLDKHTTANGTTLVDFPESGAGFTRYGEADHGGDGSLQPSVAAALFGAINEITTNDPSIIVQLGDMSAFDGSAPGTAHKGGATSHVGGRNVDVRYTRKDRQLLPLQTNSSQFDKSANQSMANSFHKFGFKSILSYSDANGNLLNNTKSWNGHHNHFHLQGFAPKTTIR